MAGARVTRTRLLTASALAGGVRNTRFRLLAGVALPGALRVTKFTLFAAAGMPGPMRVTHFRWLRAQSIHRVFYLGRLESTSSIIGFTHSNGGVGGPVGGGEPDGHGWELELVAGPIPEFNPYKPQVPESLIKIDDGGREIFDWLEEQQKTIRLQHNITQAGDTTFPYQMIINSHSEQQFTLGSLGKFYHEDYGLIHARYVQYDNLDQTIAPTAPMGLIKQTGKLDWIVTNRLDLSNPYLCVGFCAAFTMPQDGDFGWVICDGVNLQPLINTSDSVTQGEGFVWSASGQISNAGEGIIIARRLDSGSLNPVLKGRAYIRLESLSRDAIKAALDVYIQAIAQLQEDVEELQAATGIGGSLATLQTQIAQLSNRLNTETNQRKAADTAINARISALDFVTDGELNAAVNLLQANITNLQTALEASINATHAIAVEALDKANQALAMDIGAINDQITLILGLIADERVRVKGKFPVVDGSIPPNLVYMDDGSLVYTETF